MLDKLLVALVSPLGTALFIGFLAFLLAIKKRKLSAWVLGCLAWLWLCIWSLPVTSNAMYHWVIKHYPPVMMQEIKPAGAIVLLGGGIAPADLLNAEADLNSAADRVVMAAKLFHAGKAPKIWLSGGRQPTYLTSEAQAMANFLALLGVPQTALVLEESSLNTRGNAKFTISGLEAAGIKKAILVTSALHMRRSMANFEQQTVSFTPVATDYEVRMQVTQWQNFIPSSDALDMNAKIIKETAAWLLQLIKR